LAAPDKERPFRATGGTGAVVAVRSAGRSEEVRAGERWPGECAPAPSASEAPAQPAPRARSAAAQPAGARPLETLSGSATSSACP